MTSGPATASLFMESGFCGTGSTNGDVVVTALRYRDPRRRPPVARRFEHKLRSHRARFAEYHTVREGIEQLAAGRLEQDSVALLERRANILGAIASDFFVDRYSVVPRQLPENTSAVRAAAP